MVTILKNLMLDEIGIFEVGKCAKRFKLNSNDERVLALDLIINN